MDLPEGLLALLDRVVERAQQQTATDLSRKLQAIAEDFAHRGLRGGALTGAQTAAILIATQDEAKRVISNVARVAREAFSGSFPDALATPLRDYLIAYARRVEPRLHAQVLAKTYDMTIGAEVAQRTARGVVYDVVRDVEIEFGPGLLRQQLRTFPAVVGQAAAQEAAYDVFVSHASEDKADFVDGLVAALEARGLEVWYDKAVLTLGDMLSTKIADGLQRSRFGVVVLSHHFFKKQWPARELNALATAEAGDGRKRVLPVWHGVTEADVKQYNRFLAAVLGISSSSGVGAVADEIVRAIEAEA